MKSNLVRAMSFSLYGDPVNALYGDPINALYGDPINALYGDPINALYGDPMPLFMHHIQTSMNVLKDTIAVAMPFVWTLKGATIVCVTLVSMAMDLPVQVSYTGGRTTVEPLNQDTLK